MKGGLAAVTVETTQGIFNHNFSLVKHYFGCLGCLWEDKYLELKYVLLHC